MKRKDPLRILEAVYTFEADEAAWLRNIVEAARPYDLGFGIMSCTCELGARLRHRSIVGDGAEWDPKLFRAMEAMPPSIFRRAYCPTPTVFNADLMAEILRTEGVTLKEVEEKLGGPVSTAWGVIGGDANVEAILLCVVAPRRDALTPSDRVALDSIGAHLGAALRLRSLAERAPRADDVATEAVISPGGKVLDARGRGQRSLATLVEAVKRTERARSRKTTAEERLALWTALFDGQWSIVECTERDGKRMLLACRNEPRTEAIRKLTPRERSVVGYASLGHSYKYVSYELGLSVSSVSSIVRTAVRKLGLKSRAELIRVFGVKTG